MDFEHTWPVDSANIFLNNRVTSLVPHYITHLFKDTPAPPIRQITTIITQASRDDHETCQMKSIMLVYNFLPVDGFIRDVES